MGNLINKKEQDELWVAFKEGDATALVRLYQTYYSKLYKYGIKLTLNPELTKDCIHEMFCSLCEKRESLKEVTHISAYLHEYLRRQLYTQLKRNQHKYHLSQSEFQTELIFSFEEQLIQSEYLQEEKEKLKTAMENLTDRQRQIIEMKYFDGLDYEEIEHLTALKNKSIRNIVHEAMKTLRQSITVVLLFLFH
jgi:RNA polymerase sigma factor (sigma-70 family)